MRAKLFKARVALLKLMFTIVTAAVNLSALDATRELTIDAGKVEQSTCATSFSFIYLFIIY